MIAEIRRPMKLDTAAQSRKFFAQKLAQAINGALVIARGFNFDQLTCGIDDFLAALLKILQSSRSRVVDLLGIHFTMFILWHGVRNWCGTV